MNPVEVQEARGLKIGDEVRYKKSERVVERVWGKPAGKIIEIRQGRSGPLLLEGGTAHNIGSVQAVALTQFPDGSIEFSDVRDFQKM